MMRLKKYKCAALAFSLALVLIFMPLPGAFAQEAPSFGEAARNELIDSILDSVPESSPPPATTAPPVTDTAYSKIFSYSEDKVLHGIFSSESLYFKIPEYWLLGYAYAQIEYTLSRLIDNVPASLTFSVNNVPVASYAMDYSAGQTQTLYIPIPLSLLRKNYNEFSISGFVRLFDEEGCIDDFSNANWVHISKASNISIGYDALPFNGQISAYPYPLISTMDETGSGTCIYVSEEMSDGEVAAALLLRMDLASMTANNDNIGMSTASQLYADADIQSKALICNTRNLPDEFLPYTRNADGSPMRLDSYAIVRFLRDREGKPLLLIVADDDDCLMEAVSMLMDESRVSQESAAFTWVRRGSAAIASQGIGSLAAGRYTLDSLIDGGLRFIGPFHQVKDIFLPDPGGLLLSGGGKMVLHFRYSENLDFDRSMITVYWGDTPVASRKLSKERADADELSFTIPSDLIGTTATRIRIAFDLELPDLFCTPRMDEMPWAYITADSVFYLPAGEGTHFSFQTRPTPFQRSGRLNGLLVVLPDSPSPAELDTLGIVLGAYIQGVEPYGGFNVIRAGEFDEAAHSNRNILVFGKYSTSSLIRRLNESLSFKYNASGNAFQSNSQLVMSDRYAQSTASLQIIRSPFETGRAVLTALYTSPESEFYLRRFLSSDEKLRLLKGDAVLIDKDLSIKSFTFLPEIQQSAAPDIITALRENRDSLIFTLAASSSVLLLLIAVILVLLRIAAHRKKEE